MKRIELILNYEIDDTLYEDIRNEESLTQRDNWEKVFREIATDMLYDTKHKNYDKTRTNTGIRDYTILDEESEVIFTM